MIDILPWLLTLVTLLSLYPCARLAVPEGDLILVGCTALALAAGALSLTMLWCGLLGLPLDWRIPAAVVIGGGACGWLVLGRAMPLSLRMPHRERSAFPIAVWLSGSIIGGMVVLILFNAAYGVFAIDDAIAIYGWQGKQIYLSGTLPVGMLYETYPMLLPLLYAFTHSAAGWVNEGLALFVSALLSVGSIGAAYCLGRALYGGGTGRLAALLCALTPMVTHWASAGYADLPTGFFYGMSAVYLYRLADRAAPHPLSAALAGIMAGLAAWTKNSGLLILPGIGLWLISLWWGGGIPFRRVLIYGALCAAGVAATAAPWYLRSLSMAGVIIPPTGWTWLAQRTLTTLFPYLADPRYGVIGIIFSAGIILTAISAIAGIARRRRDAAGALLLALYLPFFAAWWWLVSYDGRFLLALTPLVAVMAGRVVRRVLDGIAPLFGARERLGGLFAAVVMIVLALPAAWNAVDFKDALIADPLMGLGRKYETRLGARYAAALYLRAHFAGTQVWTTDGLLPYHAEGVRVTVGNPPQAGQLAGYAALVLMPNESPPSWLPLSEPLFERAGYRIYLLPPSPS